MNALQVVVAYAVLFGITAILMWLIFSYVQGEEREIAEEEAERKFEAKYRAEKDYWKGRAYACRTSVKIINGGEREFTLEKKRR